MHAQSVIRRHHVLKNLCQRVDALESWFLSPSDLQGLGIQAGQVGIADNGNRQFRPCFFLPYPDRVLQKYPLDSHDDVRKLNPYPDYATVLRDALASSNVEDPLAFARDNPEEILELSAPDEWVGHAYNIESHVSDHLYACRKSLPKCYSLMGLGSLRGRR